MSRLMRANSTMGGGLEGSVSAVGQNPAMSSWVTRPSRKAPMEASCSLKWACSSSSTSCQSSSWFGPSMNPSTDTDIMKMSFLIGEHCPIGPTSPTVRMP